MGASLLALAKSIYYSITARYQTRNHTINIKTSQMWILTPYAICCTKLLDTSLRKSIQSSMLFSSNINHFSVFPLLFNKLLHITSSDYLFHPHHFEGPTKTCASCILWLQKLLTKNYLTRCLVDLPHQPPRHHPCPRFLQTSPPDLCERWYFFGIFSR